MGDEQRADGEPKKPRVGVYVCHCGGNISDYVDVKKVAESLKADDVDIVVSKDLMFDCSDAGQNEMIEDIRTKGLDRIVIAACSPKLHELTFRGTAERAGLNQYMLYHANIREQSSWAHGDNKAEATAKAAAEARAAIAYVKLADPLMKIKTESTQTVLVIGGGVAGMRATLDLSEKGVGVILVERSPFLGGHVAELGEIYPYGRRGSDVASEMAAELVTRGNVAVFTNAAVESFKGYVGKFEVKIKVSPRQTAQGLKSADGVTPTCPLVSEQEVTARVGSVIVATGVDSYLPKVGEFGYGVVKGVVTLPELQRLLVAGGGGGVEYQGRQVKDVAFIYCVGSRQKESDPSEGGRPPNRYCSRFCCNAAVNSAIVLSQRLKDPRIYHLYRDVRTYGRSELMYESASRQGSTFIRFDDENEPAVSERDGRCIVTVRSSLVENIPVEFAVDLVVLVTGMVPRANGELNGLLSLPIGSDGFYKEVHLKLRPVETNVAGVLIAGSAQSPKDLRETLASASAAAAKAAAFALKKELELDPFVARVDPEICEGNQMCAAECPYGAIEIQETNGRKVACVNTAKCKGCGACVAVCPTEAVQLEGLTNEEIRVMIGALAR
jgi:heterodisulfide reductase subunit A